MSALLESEELAKRKVATPAAPWARETRRQVAAEAMNPSTCNDKRERERREVDLLWLTAKTLVHIDATLTDLQTLAQQRADPLRAILAKGAHNDEGTPCVRSRHATAPPRAGEGVHDWLFRVARQLHAHLPAVEIVSLLESRVANCGRFVPRSEIISAVQNALPCAWQPGSQSQSIHSAPKWPSVNQEQREAVIASGFGLVDLWEFSSPRIDDDKAHTEQIIDRLFPGDPLLCCGKINTDFDTRPREDWRGELSRLQFIVPSADVRN